MYLRTRTSYFLLFLFVFSFGFSQEKNSGPVIENHGKVWKINNVDIEVDTTKEYKVVFDIMDSPDDKNSVNAKIETAARFLNMHAQAGVPAENLKTVLVVHNAASKDIILDDAYNKKYGTNNPNSALMAALLDADVQVIFCGQSSVSRGFPKKDLIPGVKLSLSAMTALIQLQDEGYRLIKF